MIKTTETTFLALGTVNTISAIGESAQEAVDCATKRVQELHQLLSAFNDGSDIAAVNAAAGREFVQVDRTTINLVQEAKIYAKLTGGAFDPTIRPLVKVWNIGGSGNEIPEFGEICNAMCLINYKDILLDHRRCRIMLRRKNMALDLGGIAKGFAADEVKRILLDNGVTDAVINLGGTVVILGSPRAVGIQNPERKTGLPIAHVQLSGKAAVTSGSYEKYFIKNNTRYHHLLDPRSGYPAASNIKSVTLIGDCALELDALSTAVFIQGLEKGSKTVEKFRLEAIFITDTNEVLVTSGLQDTVSLIQKREVTYG